MTNGTSVSSGRCVISRTTKLAYLQPEVGNQLVVTLKKEGSLTNTTYSVESVLIKNANRTIAAIESILNYKAKKLTLR